MSDFTLGITHTLIYQGLDNVVDMDYGEDMFLIWWSLAESLYRKKKVLSDNAQEYMCIEYFYIITIYIFLYFLTYVWSLVSLARLIS